MSRADRGRRAAFGAAIGIGTTLAMGSSAQAADHTVTTTADDGPGSLREAMMFAELVPDTSDRILFQSGLSGTISLDDDLQALASPMEIIGPGMDQLEIDGQGLHRIFESNSDLSVSGLTLARGAAGSGGGISVLQGDLSVDETRIKDGIAAQSGGGISMREGHLTLTDSEVTGNSAADMGGGIFAADSSVTVSGTTLSGNDLTGTERYSRGGGVFLYLDPNRPSTISESVISGNSAVSSGGLQAGKGDLAIDATLISGNSAAYSGGGLSLGAPGAFGTYSVTNSTITDNTAVEAGGGLFSIGPDVTVESSTITGNSVTDPGVLPGARGAGIAHGAGAMVLRNSIVSGNAPVDLATLPAIPLPPPSPSLPPGSVDGSFNLIGDKTGADFTDAVPGSNISSTNPQLGPLADNGGPTKTLLPTDASPVVNKGSSTLTTDARGLTRPVDFAAIPFSTAAGANGADIGAVELQYTTPPPPPPPSNAFSFGWVKLNKKKGVASLQVKVPGAGKVLVVGSKTVAKSSKVAKGASTIAVTIKAKGKAAKQLKKKGQAKVKASVRFTPTGGTAKTKSKTVKLVREKPKKR